MKLSLPETATVLGKSERQVRYLVRTGRLSATKEGGRWRIESSDLPLTEKQREALGSRMDAGLQLLDAVDLACIGARSEEALTEADEWLRLLRTRLLLGLEVGLFEEAAYLDYAEKADEIGRQVGGWLRKLRRSDAD